MPEDSVLSRHFEKDQKKSSKERWQNVRGDVTLQLAQQHFAAGRLKDAEAALNKVMSMTPDNPEVCKFAASLFLEMGQLAKAQEAITVAAQSGAADAEIEYLAGIIAERYGQLDRALRHYSTAMEQKPNVPEYVLAAAEMYVSLDQNEKAMQLLQSRVRDFDGCGAMTVLAAKVARLLNLRDEAVNYCRDAVHDHQTDEVVSAEIGAIFVWAGRYSEAIQILEPLVNHRNGQLRKGATVASAAKKPAASVRRALAEAYVGVEQFSEARDVLRTIMSDDPADISAWTLFCRASILDRDLAAADEAISRFNARNTPTVETLLLAGYVSLARGNPQCAVEAADRALKLEPSLESAWILRADALRSMGAMSEAREACLHAAKLDSKSTAVQVILSAIDAASPPKRSPTRRRHSISANGAASITPFRSVASSEEEDSTP